jgi:hypothetical protein
MVLLFVQSANPSAATMGVPQGRAESDVVTDCQCTAPDVEAPKVSSVVATAPLRL